MTPNSFSCFRIRAERRANDLTVEALIRDMMRSAVSTVSSAFLAVAGWYAAYGQRQQRRRHHYRRAVNAISARRLAKQLPGSPVATHARALVPLDATPPFIHFPADRLSAFPKAVAIAETGIVGQVPPAHVCAEQIEDGCESVVTTRRRQ